MSSLLGGAADKLGNRYEHWWTAYRAADVLRGTASRIRLEPPGIDGTGIEFEVDEPGASWSEQVKAAPAGGRWTPARLTREGVLSKLQNHLVAGRLVRLVLSTDASEFQTLTTRAR